MPRFQRFIAAAAFLAYPLLSHAAVVLDEPRWAALGLALLAAAVARGWRSLPVFAAAIAGALALVRFFPAAIVYLPPIALNLALCALFARTLREGSEPMVSRFARLEHGGDLPAELVVYTRRLTAIWSVFFAAMAAISAALAVWAAPIVWSVFTNVVNYALVALMFAAEYTYRRVRYRHHRHAGVVDLLRRLPSYRILA